MPLGEDLGKMLPLKLPLPPILLIGFILGISGLYAFVCIECLLMNFQSRSLNPPSGLWRH